jgi:Ca2+-binding RTX toxin-like protein
MPRRPDRANPRSNERENNFKFDISKSPPLSRDLGPGQDSVEIKHDDDVDQIRLTFTSSEVGDGRSVDSTATGNQDGGLAVRVQAEDMGALPDGNPISRFDDEGITFTTKGDATFDVRDLISGVSRGDFFDEVILGTNGADTFNEAGSTEEYYINGGMGNDVLTGGVNRDFLVGGAGSDTLDGQEGDDSFIGGGGNDTITGGAGADLFIFAGTPGTDAITDFVSGTDRIDLSAYAGVDADDVTTAASGSNTIVSVDTSGDGVADFSFTLLNSGAPTDGDYVFA